MLRRCGRCRQTKELDAFAWRRQAKGQRDNYCRPCRADYKQEHYTENRQRYVDNAKKRKDVVIRERLAYLREFFSTHPCLDCGETDWVVLEFDHLSDKLFAISREVRDRNWESVLREMAKCDVVCANCHRRRTARRGGHLRAGVAQW